MTAGSPRTIFDEARLALFWNFVAERQRIWHRRFVERQPPPWTDDPVLATTKFTNVYRELDPGTQYAIHDILETSHRRPDKIFNIMFYRLVGRSETHRALGFMHLDTYNGSKVAAKLKRLRDVEGKPVFTAAYMVSGYTQMGSRDKVDNVTRLFDRIRDDFDATSKSILESPRSEVAYGHLRRVPGLGNFLAYQTLVDLLYPLDAYDGRPLLDFSHDDWSQAGPGARVGIRMLLREGVRVADLDVMRWLRVNQGEEFSRLGIDFPYLQTKASKATPISLANIQNCLCEFHKYVKIREGTGRGRQKYTPSAGYQRTLAFFAAQGTHGIAPRQNR